MSRICIGLPVYNGEEYVGDAIDSILNQTFGDFHLIILDNASTDSTQQICEAHAQRDSRVEYRRNKENIGAPQNFNRVFEMSHSELFKWAAADDVLAPEYLARCMEVMDRDSEVVLCHSQVKVIDNHGQPLEDYLSPLTRINSTCPAERFSDLILANHACFDVFGIVRSDVLKKTPKIGNYTAADRNLLAEISLMGRVHIVPESLFFSRDHPGRSVRIVERQQLREWWGQRGAFVFPYWRCMNEHLRSISRASLPRREKLGCYRAVLTWGTRHWRHLGSDVRSVLYRLCGLETGS